MPENNIRRFMIKFTPHSGPIISEIGEYCDSSEIKDNLMSFDEAKSFMLAWHTERMKHIKELTEESFYKMILRNLEIVGESEKIINEMS